MGPGHDRLGEMKGDLVKLAFALLGVCLYATSLSSVRAQIVWLGEDRPHDSRFEVWSRATTGQIPQESINASIACRKGSCPVWGGIYNPDFEVVLDPAGFDRKSLAIDEVVVPERGTFRTTTEAWQQTRLGPREMVSFEMRIPENPAHTASSVCCLNAWRAPIT